jgi:Glycosyl transferases group 1
MVDLAKSMPEYHFLFAMRKFNKRSEKELQTLQEYILTSGVKNIEIQRNIDRMEDLLGQVSCLVLPLEDIRIKMLIPVALLEAMGRGTICFVSDLPNLKLLIHHERDAIIFSKGNLLDLQEKIRIFLTRKDISENAFHFAEEFPDYVQIAENYKKLFTPLS